MLHCRTQSLKIPALAVVWLAGLLSSAHAQEPLPDLVARVRPSVVAIVTYDSTGKRIARGSGFYAASNKVVTNKHVVQNAYKIEVQTSSQNTFLVSKILDNDKDGDLIVLQTDGSSAEIKPLRIAKVLPRAGERVMVVGNPLGLEGSVSDGIVSAFRTDREIGTLIQITAPISPGSSGSPVVNMRGEVVGVATLYLERGQNLNFAISADRVSALWRDLDTSPAATSSESDEAANSISAEDQRLTGAELYAKAKIFMQQVKYREALSYFRAALAKGYDYSNLVSTPERRRDLQMRASAHFFIGQVFYQISEYDQAIEPLERAIRLNPDDTCSSRSGDPSLCAAYHYLGLTHYALRRYEDAEESFKTAIRINSNDAQLKNASIYSLGLTYYNEGKRDAALEQERLLRQSDPDRAKKLLSLVRNISGDWQTSQFSTYQIHDDGQKITVKYLGSIWYEAEWVGDIAIGYIFRESLKTRFILKPVDSTHIWFRYYGGLNLKEPPEKVLNKALKEAEKQPDEVWTKVRRTS